jgi:NitT/TauT family transport system permease protein
MLKRLLGRSRALAGIIGFLLAWEAASRLFHLPAYVLPPPSMIIHGGAEKWRSLLGAASFTVQPMVLGFVVAVVLGVAIALGVAFSPGVRSIAYPLLVFLQIVPKIAVAPLFIIWFGFGLTPKVVIAALIAFFPIVINTARGLNSVEKELIQYMNSLGANWWEIFFKISLPWALPYIFASFRIAITLAVVGAVVGEFISSDSGLGYVISYANTSLDTDVMFAGIFVLSALGVVLFLLVVLLERMALSWQASVEAGPETM